MTLSWLFLTLSTIVNFSLPFLKKDNPPSPVLMSPFGLIAVKGLFARVISAAVLLFLLPTVGCRSPESSLVRREQVLMGTTVSISIAGVRAARANEAADLAFREIRRIEGLMSTYLPDSEVSRINRSAGQEWTRVDPEVLSVIREALHISRISGGAFDISYKPLGSVWRFEPGSRPPDPPTVSGLLPLVDYRKILIDRKGRVLLKRKGMAIGLGGIAKGYAVDRAAALLRRQGIRNAIINAGGDLLVFGRRSPKNVWTIGIQDPRDPTGVLGELHLTKGAVATSGDYERFYIYRGVRYHHILNPRTGFPARGVRSVTITAPSAMQADALATAVFVLGTQEGLALVRHLSGVETMIVDGKGKIFRSRGFQSGGIE